MRVSDEEFWTIIARLDPPRAASVGAYLTEARMQSSLTYLRLALSRLYSF